MVGPRQPGVYNCTGILSFIKATLKDIGLMAKAIGVLRQTPRVATQLFEETGKT